MSGTRLTILEYPDPRLKTRAQPVAAVDEGLRRLMDDMLATLRATQSLGLAATQVDVHLRVVVIDQRRCEGAGEPAGATDEGALVLVNPEILSRELPGMSEEQCLSVPGITAAVPRSLRVRVRAQGRDGAPFELDAEGLLAVCIQHEVEHLDGTLFIDHLSWFKRLRVRHALRARAAGA